MYLKRNLLPPEEARGGDHPGGGGAAATALTRTEREAGSRVVTFGSNILSLV